MGRYRGILVALLLLCGALAPSPAQAAEPQVAADPEIHDDDRILGDAKAPITIIEYSSLTCPHCAAFHADALQTIKSDWVEPGKVRLVYRHFPLDGLALRAAAVSNCIEGPRFFAFLDILFENQQRWARASDPLAALSQYAGLAGLNKEKFESCVSDEATMNKILEGTQEARDVLEVKSTPTLFINGERFEGERSMANFERLFRKLAPDS